MNLELSQIDHALLGVLMREDEEEMRSFLSQRLQDVEDLPRLLHFAQDNNKKGAFRVVFEEAVKKHNLDRILNVKDHRGSTVFQIIVANTLVDPVKLVLADATAATTTTTVETETTLDIIRDCEAGERETAILDIQGGEATTSTSALVHSSMEAKGVLLTGLCLFLTLSLTVASNPPALIMVMEAQHKTLSFIDIVTGSMPASFYLFVCNTTLFVATMGAITVLLCFLPCLWVTLFLVLMVTLLYILFVDKAVPRYTVKIGSRSVSSSVLVWISVLALICFGATVVAVVKYVRSCVYQYRQSLKRQYKSNYASCTHQST